MPDDLQQLLSLLDPRPFANTLWQNRGLLNPAPLVQGVGNVGRMGGAALADLLAGQDTSPIPYNPQDHINAMRGIAIDHANAMKEIAREGEPPMGGQPSSSQQALRQLYQSDQNPDIQTRENQDLWMQFRGPRGYQAAAAPDTGVGAPLDYNGLLRDLVQVAQTPQHPHQQTALRHLVHLALLHHAMTRNQAATAPRTTTAPTAPAPQ